MTLTQWRWHNDADTMRLTQQCWHNDADTMTLTKILMTTPLTRETLMRTRRWPIGLVFKFAKTRVFYLWGWGDIEGRKKEKGGIRGGGGESQSHTCFKKCYGLQWFDCPRKTVRRVACGRLKRAHWVSHVNGRRWFYREILTMTYATKFALMYGTITKKG